MPILDHFGVLAPFYDRLLQPKLPEKLWEYLRLPTDGFLLDAGGGTGRLAQFMTGKSEAVFLADLSREMLVEAQNKNGLFRVCSHSECLPFPSESFSRIMMVDALHHVCDQPQTARELWRLLEPGGYLVIEEPDFRKFPVKLIAVAEKLALMRSHFLSPQAIVGLFGDPEADITIETEGDWFNAWVIIHKKQAK